MDLDEDKKWDTAVQPSAETDPLLSSRNIDIPSTDTAPNTGRAQLEAPNTGRIGGISARSGRSNKDKASVDIEATVDGPNDVVPSS